MKTFIFNIYNYLLGISYYDKAMFIVHPAIETPKQLNDEQNNTNTASRSGEILKIIVENEKGGTNPLKWPAFQSKRIIDKFKSLGNKIEIKTLRSVPLRNCLNKTIVCLH